MVEVKLMLLTKGLSYAARSFPNKTAIIDSQQKLTYKELSIRTAKLKDSLIGLEVKKGDRVALLMLNGFRYLEIMYGVLATGAAMVPLNTRLNLVEIVDILNDSGAEILFVHREYLPLVSKLKTQVPCLRHIILAEDEQVEGMEGVHSYELLLKKQLQTVFSADDIHEDDLAGIFYTGGTTGRSKGVMLSHKNMVSNAYHVIANFQYNENDTYLHASPMFHLADGASTFSITMVGGTHTFIRSFTTKSVFDCIEQNKVTCSILVPTMINFILNDPNFDRYDLTTLKKIIYGASPISETLLEKCSKLLPQAEPYQAYGMTEASPILSILKPKDHGGERIKGCGQSIQNVEMKVVDPEGNEVPVGKIGEFIAKGPNVMKGYWNLDEETASVLRNGWFYTGDIGYKDDDEFYYLVDRAKDMIITGGENVYSIEVENTFYKHPAVLECAVLGVPDEKWGEAVKAVIVLKPQNNVTAEELHTFASQQLANYKVPKTIEFIYELPKSGAGKILKRALRDQYWPEQARAVN